MVSNHPQAVFLPRFVPHVFNLTRNRHCTSNTMSCQQCSTSTPELMFTTVSDPAPTTMAQSRSLSPMSTTSDRPMPPSRPLYPLPVPFSRCPQHRFLLFCPSRVRYPRCQLHRTPPFSKSTLAEFVRVAPSLRCRCPSRRTRSSILLP